MRRIRRGQNFFDTKGGSDRFFVVLKSKFPRINNLPPDVSPDEENQWRVVQTKDV
jgi:hypothetical protein